MVEYLFTLAQYVVHCLKILQNIRKPTKIMQHSLKNKLLCNIILIGCLAFCSWGFLVHRTTHQLAIYQLPKPMQDFFYANADYLIKHSVRPDTRKKHDPTEDTKHFIDFEAYGKNAAYTMPFKWADAVKKYPIDTLKKYGYVPYVIADVQSKLTNAFKQGNKDSILFYAADLGHYIADAHVPLHTTLNYDGQLTNQKGIHSLWESMIPEIEIENFNLYTPHTATYIKNLDAAIWKTVRQSHALVNNLLLQERAISKTMSEEQKYRTQIRRGKEVKSYTTAFAKAYHAALKNSINQQLILSSEMIANCWFTAWVNAGKPNLEKCFATPTKSQLDELNIELASYKKNTLLKENLLKAKEKNKADEE